MKFLTAVIVAMSFAPLAVSADQVRLAALTQKESLPQSKPNMGEQKLALTCFKSGEEKSGLNKICYYNCAGSTAAITLSSVKLCPLSINR